MTRYGENAMLGDGMSFDAERAGSGTREWAEHSHNIGIGCSHNCRYCYARERALRFKLIASPEEWSAERIPKKSRSKVKRKAGVTMFPTTHDITPFYADTAIESLKALLSAGNEVLIVSKPHLDITKALVRELRPWVYQTMFRFTIGTLDKDEAVLWEPGAPSPSERIAALEHAYGQGYRTSISAEPMLSSADGIEELVRTVAPAVTDSIWIGKMNKIRQRVIAPSQGLEGAIDSLERWQADDSIILGLVARLKDECKVMLKESVSIVVERATYKAVAAAVRDVESRAIARRQSAERCNMKGPSSGSHGERAWAARRSKGGEKEAC